MTVSGPITIEAAGKLIDQHTTAICGDTLVQEPVISVCLLTYNHQAYLHQALAGVVEQKTQVPFEIVIGDDCSTDGTTETVLEFQRNHPDRVRVLLATQNLGHHTGNGRLNFIRTLRTCRGRYIAMLDGDDYWISKHKLQRQFDAMEAHANWAICFHRAQVVHEKPGETDFELPGADAKEIYTLTDMLAGNFMATATVMFRNGLMDELPQWFYETRIADWPLHVLHAQHGQIGFLQDTMAVHRINENGVFSAMDDGARWRMTHEVFETMRQNLQTEHEVEFAEAGDRLMDRMFQDMSSLRVTVDRLREANRQLSQSRERQIEDLQTGYERCLSMRVGRILTWPLRVLTQPFRNN